MKPSIPRNDLMDICNELFLLQTEADKAATMCNALQNDYFDQENPEAWVITHDYKDAQTKHNIAFDYVLAVEKAIGELHGKAEALLSAERPESGMAPQEVAA